MSNIDEHIEFPVRHDKSGWIILGADNGHVADVRGWGRHQYETINGVRSVNDERGAKIMDAIGDYIAAAMNAKYERERPKTRDDDFEAAGFTKETENGVTVWTRPIAPVCVFDSHLFGVRGICSRCGASEGSEQ